MCRIMTDLGILEYRMFSYVPCHPNLEWDHKKQDNATNQYGPTNNGVAKA